MDEGYQAEWSIFLLACNVLDETSLPRLMFGSLTELPFRLFFFLFMVLSLQKKVQKVVPSFPLYGTNTRLIQGST